MPAVSEYLDRSRTRSYNAALFALALFVLGGVAWAGGEFKVRGAWLPGGAAKIAEDRYRAPQGWEETLKFYKNTYPPAKYPRRSIVNQPGIKAVHIVNVEAKEDWEGMNVYEYQGEVRVFVLARVVAGGK
jgi:hypothetical protein